MAKKRQGFTAEDLVNLLNRKPKNLPTAPFPVFLLSYDEPPVCTMVGLTRVNTSEGEGIEGKIDSSIGATAEEFAAVQTKLSEAMFLIVSGDSGKSGLLPPEMPGAGELLPPGMEEGRVYAPPMTVEDFLLNITIPSWAPTVPLPILARDFSPPAFVVTEIERNENEGKIIIHVTREGRDLGRPSLDFKEALAAMVGAGITVHHIPEPETASMITTHPTRETLRVSLTEMEIVEHARAAARANSELLRLEEELKAIKSDYKAQMDKEQAKLNEHSGKVNTGWEMRPVPCTIRKNYQFNTITITRDDTFEVVRERTMSADERQMGLDLPVEAEVEAGPYAEAGAEAAQE